MDGQDGHEEGIRWLTLAAASGNNYQAKLVCLQRAVTYLGHASTKLRDTPRYAKSLRNLGMAHWLTAQTTEQSSSVTPIISIVEMYKEALRYYAGFRAERLHHLAVYLEEYEQCLDEALTLCERLPPKEAVTSIESYLGVIPARQGSYRYKCLLKMSDILEFHAKISTMTENWGQESAERVRADPEQLEQLLSGHSTPQQLDVESKMQTEVKPQPEYDLVDGELSPRQTLHMLRSYQDPKHTRHLLAAPEILKPLGILTELGRAKYYFSMSRVRTWLRRTRPPKVYDNLTEAITRALHKYRTLDEARACLDNMQQLHEHSAFQLLGTLHSIYNILTPFTPSYTLPSLELKSLTRVQYALDKALRCVESDLRRAQEIADAELQEIMEIMVRVVKQSETNFRKLTKLDKESSSPGELIERLQQLWDPFLYLLPAYSSKNPLSVLLASRSALDMASKHDKDDFCLVLSKRLTYFQNELVVHGCITQLLEENKNEPTRLLSRLYQAYPPSQHWQSSSEETMAELSPKQIRQHIDLAMKSYVESNVKHVYEEVKPILQQIREQLNRPKTL